MSSSIEASVARTSESAGLFDFYRTMDGKGRLTFWACTGGWTLDGMDFMLFPLVIGTLVATWGMDLATAGSISSLTLLCSAAGGWLAGYASDRIGRVRTMQITILLFSAGSLLSAFAQDPTQLAIFRAILGFGFGGEAAVAAVTLSEVVDARYRGRAMGFYQSSYSIGWTLAVLIQIGAFAIFPPETAWRAMFGIGALPALMIFFIRRNVQEPQIFAQTKTNSKDGFSVLAIFGPENIRSTILGAMLTIGAQGGFYSLMTWLPQFLRSAHKISVIGSAPYLFTLISGCFLGYVTGGWLSDRLGRRPVFLIFSVCAAGLAYVYTHLNVSNELVLIMGFPLGFFASGYYSAIMPCLNEMYSTSVRGSGVGFTYNAGRAVGGLFPFFVGFVTAYVSLGDAISIFAGISYGLMFLTALLLRETNGMTLRS
jgi:MFS family permease